MELDIAISSLEEAVGTEQLFRLLLQFMFNPVRVFLLWIDIQFVRGDTILSRITPNAR